ncbi:hypothetical protein, partial [Aeromonas caviae]|uniref:hypothetical protein n=1 Tax=Aeromonas caviae TaxID=648 RepID=UPI0010065A8B
IGALAKAAELLINMVSAAKMVLIFIGLPHFVVIARLSLITIYNQHYMLLSARLHYRKDIDL